MVKVLGLALKGWRYSLFVGGVVGLIGAALYPIIIYPYFHVDKYREKQRITRGGIDQEAIQPGGMKIWSDPFERKK